MPTLRLSQFVPRRSTTVVCHFAAARFTTTRVVRAPHDHDFTELAWVEAGRGWHHVNGRRQPMTAGTVICVRPRDTHEFTAAATDEPLRFWNLAFAPGRWRAVRARYRLFDLFADDPTEPVAVSVRGGGWAALAAVTDDLRAGRRDAATLDRFLLALARATEPPAPPDRPAPPAWLVTAIERATAVDDPDVLAAGARALARLAGKSPEHVARAARRFLGRTPTDIVNGIKLARAARQLAETGDPVLDVAYDCGFANLSHFYALFAARYGTTPRRYRLDQRAIVRP